MPDTKTDSPLNRGIAVGAYLRYLREAQRKSLADIANQIEADPSQVWRIEHWKTDVRSSMLFGFIRAVNGNAEDVALLFNNPRATKEDGETLARLRLGLLRG